MSFLNSLKSAAKDIGREISKGVDSAEREINSAYYGAKSSPLLDNFRTGNQIQLVSRSSGRTLQIVTAGNGQIVVDGSGMEGPQVTNAIWIITDMKSNIVTLHNNNNFLTINNGQTCLKYYPDTNQVGRETHFRVIQIQNFVCLESIAEPGRHIGVLNSGQLKSALACGREIDGQFGVRLIYSPYPRDSQHGKTATYRAPPPSYPGYVVAPPGAASSACVAPSTGVTVVQTTTYPPAAPPPYRK